MIDAADFKQYIFPLLFFKRISDLWDEECKSALDRSDGDLSYGEFAENQRFQIPDGCHWEDVRKKTVDVGAYLQKSLNGIEKASFEMLHDVFDDAQWTNKRRMSDEKMLDLIEHFSKMKLTVAEVPHDIMGEGYEYLIKKFADDSGHTAAEFYTNRTVNQTMVCTYCEIRRMIVEDAQQGIEKAHYGKQVLKELTNIILINPND